MKRTIIVLFAALTLLAGCFLIPEELLNEQEEKNKFDPKATELTANIWADGIIATLDKEQWFKFTATASMQYIHPSFGTLKDLYVQVYDSKGVMIGNREKLPASKKYIDGSSFTVGDMYYIKVTPYYSNDTGTYKIAFNTSETAPSP